MCRVSFWLQAMIEYLLIHHTDAPNEATNDEEVNFFAPKESESKKSKKNKKKAAKSTKEVEPLAKPVTVVDHLDEDECRQILKSHRIKVTRLATRKKEEAKQLYPQPLQAFSELQTSYGISKRLGENIASQGYKIPTEVQMGSLPLLMKPELAFGPSLDEDIAEPAGNVDLLAVAPTGSGKTLAFLIPVVNSMIQRRRQETNHSNHRLEAVVVAPTKELVSQIVNEGRKLASGTGIKVVEMRKGMRVVAGPDEEPQTEEGSELEDDVSDTSDVEDELKVAQEKQPLAKADILVTTPLALLNSLAKAQVPTVRHLILDEADVLLDPLFREQTVSLWEACINPELSVTLWSATMGSNIETLASGTIKARRKTLKIKSHNTLVRLVIGLKDSAIPNIEHKMIYTATESGKLLAIRQLLRPVGLDSSAIALRPPFLVFTQTIPRAIALHSELLYDIPIEAGGSSRIAVLHSDLSTTVRSNIMTRFRNGEIWVLITTDILSRGVDFRGVNGVVNYDVPNSGAAYIHRVGRTGRAGRDGGIAVTFYTKEDIPYVRTIATIIAASEKAAGKTGGEASMQKWLLDALPKVSKKDKQALKKGGIAVRRTAKAESGKEVAKGRISSKSGYERKVENRRKGAIEGSKRRSEIERNGGADDETAGEWGGFDE